MADNIKNSIPTAKERLINKVKEAGYNFNEKEFKHFQEFFSREFSNIDIEELRNKAWRKR